MSSSASPYLQRAAESTRDPLTVTRSLRRELSADRTALVLEQVELRRRARDKFSRADQMFFLRTLLEQATEERIALYKGSRFPLEQPVIDLCCGLGGDLLGLAQRGPTCGLDRSPFAAQLAAANLRAYGHAVDVHVGDVQAEANWKTMLWHIDPDRRVSGRRHTHADLFDPPTTFIDSLRERSPSGAVKLAPATSVPPAWQAAAELEWIGSRRECRQQVAWFGELAHQTGTRRATVLDAAGAAESVHAAGEDDWPLASSHGETIGPFLCEPHAAVLAARLAGELARQFHLTALSPRVAYFTGSVAPHTRLLAVFEVLDVLPFDIRQLKKALRARNIGRLEIKVRGLDVAPDRLRKQLAATGDQELTLLIAGPADRVRAILARRRATAEPV